MTVQASSVVLVVMLPGLFLFLVFIQDTSAVVMLCGQTMQRKNLPPCDKKKASRMVDKKLTGTLATDCAVYDCITGLLQLLKHNNVVLIIFEVILITVGS
jgi:hypothetical protein